MASLRWEKWSPSRLLLAGVWLLFTVGGGIVWIIAAMFGSSLSDSGEIEGPIRFTLVGGVLGALGLLGVWTLRRTRPWVVAAMVFGAASLLAAFAYVLDS